MSGKKKPAAAKKKPAAQQSAPQVDRQKSAPQVESQEPANGPVGHPVSEKQAKASGLSEYRPKHQKLENAGLDHQAAEDDRVKARSAQRDEHNTRTGDVSR